jgi:UDP-2,3-diacylglucosamine pyrophosphatase LpxH
MNGPVIVQLPHRHRTVFISDLHLGSSHCHAEPLAEFLEALHCEQLYLVGDVFDLQWLSERRLAWTPAQTAVIEAIRMLAQHGTQVIYIPGNHDWQLRRFCGLVLPGVNIRRRAIHRTADGRRLLVTHGDEFDAQVRHGGAREWLGEWLYYRILSSNRLANRWRRSRGQSYWSLASFLKRQSGSAERYIERFRHALVSEARRRGLDGVVCGHIHRPELRLIDGIWYVNDGDWVESLSAITESFSGELELRYFHRQNAARSHGALEAELA